MLPAVPLWMASFYDHSLEMHSNWRYSAQPKWCFCFLEIVRAFVQVYVIPHVEHPHHHLLQLQLLHSWCFVSNPVMLMSLFRVCWSSILCSSCSIFFIFEGHLFPYLLHDTHEVCLLFNNFTHLIWQKVQTFFFISSSSWANFKMSTPKTAECITLEIFQ